MGMTPKSRYDRAYDAELFDIDQELAKLAGFGVTSGATTATHMNSNQMNLLRSALNRKRQDIKSRYGEKTGGNYRFNTARRSGLKTQGVG